MQIGPNISMMPGVLVSLLRRYIRHTRLPGDSAFCLSGVQAVITTWFRLKASGKTMEEE
jgi:hypothetical protein